MSSNFCEYIVDWNHESEGEPIFCDKPAGIKAEGMWFCPEHFDLVIGDTPADWYDEEEPRRSESQNANFAQTYGGGYVYRQG